MWYPQGLLEPSQDLLTPTLTTERLSNRKEESKLASALLLICSTPFPSWTPRSLPMFPKGHSLEGASLLWPPMAGKTIKATLFNFTQNSSVFLSGTREQRLGSRQHSQSKDSILHLHIYSAWHSHISGINHTSFSSQPTTNILNSLTILQKLLEVNMLFSWPDSMITHSLSH